MLWSVAVPSRPPNVMIGDRHAKYMNSIDDKHWKLSASVISLHNHGVFLLMSSIRPPQNRPVNSKPGSASCGWMSSSLLFIDPLSFDVAISSSLSSCVGTFVGGSSRMFGSHSPGGSTVTWSRNSSNAFKMSCLFLALYATSWKIWKIEIDQNLLVLFKLKPCLIYFIAH